MPGLACDSTPIASRFDPSDLSWTAHDAISAIEAARSTHVAPVKFYMYDAPLLPTSVEAELEVMRKCRVTEKNYHYGGEYYFLKQLVNHRWRVSDPADAALLVVPSLASFQVPRGRSGGIRPQFCPGLTPVASIMSTIARTEMWR